MQYVGEFIGRFHPVLVHLPIGILLIAVAFIWLDYFKKIAIQRSVIQLTLVIGVAGAVLSIITGLLLGNSGDYDPEALDAHMWMGILAGAMSITLWLCYFDDNVKPAMIRSGSVALVILLTLAGHRGGSLTHGSDYLTAPLLKESGAGKTPDLSDINTDSAIFYADVIHPLFEARCYSCHGETKQKGQLRLDNPELILKGGKSGKIIVAGNPEESELIKRLGLPNEDEDHMPPKEKPQFTEEEKKWIELWVRSGANFTKTISAIVSKKELSELHALSPSDELVLPKKEVGEPDEKVMDQLIERGVSISRLSRETNFLQANFISIPKEAHNVLKQLNPLAKHVVVLKLSSTEVNDNSLKEFGDFENLMKLNLSQTKITDAGVDVLLKCESLTHVNFENTQVSAAGILKLRALKKLKYVNVYKTLISENERASLIEALPTVEIEFGGYEVPTLSTDTARVKPI